MTFTPIIRLVMVVIAALMALRDGVIAVAAGGGVAALAMALQADMYG